MKKIITVLSFLAILLSSVFAVLFKNYIKQNENFNLQNLSNSTYKSNNNTFKYYFLNDKNSIVEEEIPLNLSYDNLSFRIQYQYKIEENWCAWISNSLNHVNSNNKLVNFNKTNNNNGVLNLINSNIKELVNSIYPKFKNIRDYPMPSVYKKMWGAPYFCDPEEEWKKNSKNIFGIPIQNEKTHRISRLSPEGDSSIYISDWSNGYINFNNLNFNKVEEIYNFFKINKVYKTSVLNKSFSSESYFYKLIYNDFWTKRTEPNYSGGTSVGRVSVYDNSNKNFQNEMVSGNNLDYYYNNNTIINEQDNSSNTYLGIKDKINYINYLNVDFSNIFKIQEQTNDYLNDQNDSHNGSVKIVLGLNNELINAFEEINNINELLKYFLKNYSFQSKEDIFNINVLLFKIYKNYLSLNDVINCLKNNNFNFKNKYSTLFAKLRKYNWEFITKEFNISNQTINLNLLLEILNRSIIINFVLPNILCNDLWVKYIVDDKVSYHKFWDSKTKKFNDLVLNSNKNYSHDLILTISDVYLYNPKNNEVISSKNSINNTLSPKGLIDYSKVKNNYELVDNNLVFKFNIFNNKNESNNSNKKESFNNLLISEILNFNKDELLDFTIKNLNKDSGNILNLKFINLNNSFNNLNITENDLKDPKLKDYILFKNLKDKYLTSKNNFLNNKISEDEYFQHKYNLDNLMYYCLEINTFEDVKNLFSYKQYDDLIKNNILIKRNSAPNNYTYWLKINLNTIPTKISELSNYININKYDYKDNYLKNIEEINNIKIFLRKFSEIISDSINNFQIFNDHLIDDKTKSINKKYLNLIKSSGSKKETIRLLIERNYYILKHIFKSSEDIDYSIFDYINKLSDFFIKSKDTFLCLLFARTFLYNLTFEENSQKEDEIIMNISFSFDLNKYFINTNNEKIKYKYWVLNNNSLNEFFYCSKKSFLEELNKVIKNKTNINFNLNSKDIFSFRDNFTNNNFNFIVDQGILKSLSFNLSKKYFINPNMNIDYLAIKNQFLSMIKNELNYYDELILSMMNKNWKDIISGFVQIIFMLCFNIDNNVDLIKIIQEKYNNNNSQQPEKTIIFYLVISLFVVFMIFNIIDLIFHLKKTSSQNT